MKNRYYLVVLFAVVCTVWSEAESQDINIIKEMERCSSPLTVLLGNGEFAVAYTKQGLDRLCRDVNRAWRCLDNLLVDFEKLRNEANRLYHERRVLFKKLCHPGPYQEEYLTHAPCLGEDNDDYKHCLLKFKQDNQQLTGKFEESAMGPDNGSLLESCNQLQADCSLIRENRACVTRAALEECGEQAAKFFEDYLSQKESPFIKEYCKNFDQGQCLSASRKLARSPPFP